MNDSQDDPYNTLNLPRDATQSQIKSAYRKLALKYHPDKQKSEQDKKTCSDLFAKIGNAYEVLGDPRRRAEYDRYGTIGGAEQQQQQQQQQHNPFNGFFGAGSPFMNDQFFTGQGHGQQQHHDFMDPFEIFRSVFGQEQMHRFGFDDQGHANGHANDHPSMMTGGGGHMANHMNSHMNMMNSMMNMHSPFGGMSQDMMSAGMMNQGGGGGNGFSSFSSSSSSTFGGGAGGHRESVSTSTRIVNGKRQTVTERTIVKPDGTVERTTETSGDDDFPSALEYNNNGHGHGNGYNEHQLQGSGGFFGSRR
jgi:curved DNA-binding protein CbpA